MHAPSTEDDLDLNLDGLELAVSSILTDGYILRDFTSITEGETEAAYALAYQLFNQQQYVKAERLFTVLCQLDHYDGRFWLGLGASRQMQNKYADAVNAYAMAGIHDMENPVPPLRCAECYLALDRIEDAENGATAAIHWAGDEERYRQIRARAELILEGIQRRKEPQL